jgi:hypothetical protein
MKKASCHGEKMEAYCNAVRALEDKFYGIKLNHIPRKYNEKADELAKIASGQITVPLNVFARDIAEPSIDLSLASSNQEEPSGAPSSLAGAEPMDEDPRTRCLCSPTRRVRRGQSRGHGNRAPPAEDWQTKYLAWIDQGELPSDQTEARCIARKAKSFTVIDGELYKRTASGILQLCIPIPHGWELIRDIHPGVCGHHAAVDGENPST